MPFECKDYKADKELKKISGSSQKATTFKDENFSFR